MNIVITLDRTALINGNPVRVIGPFESMPEARRWALMANAILEAQDVKEITIDVMDDPADLI
jgi:hypothetical protein